ncbi:unnamed protein product, partial [Ectocarpus sp. 12 AP-2014]
QRGAQAEFQRPQHRQTHTEGGANKTQARTTKSETNQPGSRNRELSPSQEPVTKVVRIFFWGSLAQKTPLPFHNARHCRSYPALSGCRSASTPLTKLPRDILQPVSPSE